MTNEEQKTDNIQGNWVLPCVSGSKLECIVRVFDKYFKTKVDAESIEDAEQIIKNTIIGFEYQIMNIYKTNE